MHEPSTYNRETGMFCLSHSSLFLNFVFHNLSFNYICLHKILFSIACVVAIKTVLNNVKSFDTSYTLNIIFKDLYIMFHLACYFVFTDL